MTELSENFLEDLEELSAAEEFLDYFEVPYDAHVVQVNRLHILQRFHDYLKSAQATMPTLLSAQRELYKNLLTQAYQDFVTSDALTEKVFKVFHMHEPQSVFVSVEDVFK